MKSKGITISVVFFTIFTCLSAFFWYAFYERYLKYADCIAEVVNGSCIRDDSNTTSAGIIWSVPALFFALLAVISLCIVLYRRIRLR
jgi:hypothetical protein